ncbi:MAG: four helix bundle protein [Verrucomicrobium sp.]
MEPEVTESGKRQGGFAESFGDLEVYKLAFALQQDIFKLSRAWPREEAYSLTDQIRRSSRSVGACIAEAWGKRRYEAHFFSKLTDADAELNETLHWLRTSYTCQYIPLEVCEPLAARIKSIAKMLNRMMASASSFCLPNPYRP